MPAYSQINYVRVRQEMPESSEFEAVEFSAVAGTQEEGDGLTILPDKPATFSDGRPLDPKYVARLSANVAAGSSSTPPGDATSGQVPPAPGEESADQGREANSETKEN